MIARRFALVMGVVYLLVGLMGLLGIGLSQPADMTMLNDLNVTAQSGYLLGLFPVNVLHNIVHLVIGALGVALSRQTGSARGYARGLAVFYGLLAIMGLIPALNTTLGLIPIFGHDVWLHALSAIAAGVVGFMVRDEVVSVDAGRTTRPQV